MGISFILFGVIASDEFSSRIHFLFLLLSSERNDDDSGLK
jgi:hypothetical protein